MGLVMPGGPHHARHSLDCQRSFAPCLLFLARLRATAEKTAALAFFLLLSCPIAQAGVTCGVPNPNHHQGSSAMPLWFSGTNCDACGIAGTNTPGAWINHVQLLINGTVVRDVFYPSPSPFPAQPSAVFDSTHFADGSSITITIKAWDSAGGYNEASNSAPAYNKAYVFGNVVPGSGGIGTLQRGYYAAQMIAGHFGSANHAVDPASPTTAVNQRKSAILNKIKWATAFAAYTHGDPGLIGDSATNNPDGDWVTSSEIYNKRITKTASEPPYNFVLIDACSVGITDSISNAFGVGTSYGPNPPDRAFLGWTTTMLDNPDLNSWTNRLFQRLLAGDSLQICSKLGQ